MWHGTGPTSEPFSVIVVSDTSPISNLVALGKLAWLKALFTHVVISQEVFHELRKDEVAHAGAQKALEAGWLHIQTVSDRTFVNHLLRQVHIGEATAIALAKELSADFVLIDERAGAQLATQSGLRTIGVLGILLEAKTAGLITEVRPWLDRLREEIGFWVSDPVYQYVLGLAEE